MVLPAADVSYTCAPSGVFRQDLSGGYSCGVPLNPETHLYVTLRCMHICPPEYRLYAGGGILKESTEQQEWLETEAKMDTMARLTTAG